MKEIFTDQEAKEIWNKTAPQISQERISEAYNHLDDFVKRSRRQTLLRRGGVSVFAVVACLLFGFIAGRYLSRPEATVSSSYSEFYAGNGQVKDFLLSDGSHVYLNSESSLSCPERFDGIATRDVFLNGEAFFEVAKDSDHPFIVHAAGKNIKVTGTKFNVRAFLDERSTTTTLLEGGVEVSLPSQTNPIVLNPGQALCVSEDNAEVSLYKVDNLNAIGWYKGEFNAYHMSLSQICRDLERKYDVKILISNKNLASRLYFASFVNNEDAEQILNALNVQSDFKIRKQNKFYTIY